MNFNLKIFQNSEKFQSSILKMIIAFLLDNKILGPPINRFYSPESATTTSKNLKSATESTMVIEKIVT